MLVPSRARSARCCAASGCTPLTWSTGAANARPGRSRPWRANERLATRLAQAERIIEIQGKVSELLGIPLDPASDDEQSAT
jgi:hypothetical protein